MQAASVEALKGAELLGRGPAQCNVCLPFLLDVLVQAGMHACMVCGRLALVDGGGLCQDQGELAPLCLAAVLVVKRSAAAADGHAGGFIRGLPFAPCILVELDPHLLDLSVAVRSGVLHDSTSAVDQAVLDVEVLAQHDLRTNC